MSFATTSKPAAANGASQDKPAPTATAGEVNLPTQYARNSFRIVREIDRGRILKAIKDAAADFAVISVINREKGYGQAADCCRREEQALLDLHNMLASGCLYIGREL